MSARSRSSSISPRSSVISSAGSAAGLWSEETDLRWPRVWRSGLRASDIAAAASSASELLLRWPAGEGALDLRPKPFMMLRRFLAGVPSPLRFVAARAGDAFAVLGESFALAAGALFTGVAERGFFMMPRSASLLIDLRALCRLPFSARDGDGAAVGPGEGEGEGVDAGDAGDSARVGGEGMAPILPIAIRISTGTSGFFHWPSADSSAATHTDGRRSRDTSSSDGLVACSSSFAAA
mmetsp:Transcript_8152/g.34263  ORF Transcript_8152/g.34263 Transcript_8152/m.34263 type:complete len:237 (-) Transcript_8152:1793-2503(-)